MSPVLNKQLRQCIEDCGNCYKSCITTMVHCLTMGGEHSEVTHIQLLKDCAELCKLSESFMLRGSDFAEELCKLCADICEQCADNCEKVGPEDAQMGECAQLCRKCAESCRAI